MGGTSARDFCIRHFEWHKALEWVKVVARLAVLIVTSKVLEFIFTVFWKIQSEEQSGWLLWGERIGCLMSTLVDM